MSDLRERMDQIAALEDAMPLDTPDDVPGMTLRNLEANGWTLTASPTPLSRTPHVLPKDRCPDCAALPATPAETGLREAALTLFDPMEHGSPSKPNTGHTPETYCAACVSVRAKRTQAIRRALVALGALPSVSLRAALSKEERPTPNPSPGTTP